MMAHAVSKGLASPKVVTWSRARVISITVVAGRGPAAGQPVATPLYAKQGTDIATRCQQEPDIQALLSAETGRNPWQRETFLPKAGTEPARVCPLKMACLTMSGASPPPSPSNPTLSSTLAAP